MAVVVAVAVVVEIEPAMAEPGLGNCFGMTVPSTGVASFLVGRHVAFQITGATS